MVNVVALRPWFPLFSIERLFDDVPVSTGGG